MRNIDAFIVFKKKQDAEQTVDLLVIWDAMTHMWRPCDDLYNTGSCEI